MMIECTTITNAVTYRSNKLEMFMQPYIHLIFFNYFYNQDLNKSE